jgi:hypothetical protein
LQAFTAEVAVPTFGVPEVAAASFRFGEAVTPPFSFLAFMTKAQPSPATCVITAARCDGEKSGDRRTVSSDRDTSSAAAGATSDSSASASSCSS